MHCLATLVVLQDRTEQKRPCCSRDACARIVLVSTGRKSSGAHLSRVEDDLQGVLLHIGVRAGQELDQRRQAIALEDLDLADVVHRQEGQAERRKLVDDDILKRGREQGSRIDLFSEPPIRRAASSAACRPHNSPSMESLSMSDGMTSIFLSAFFTSAFKRKHVKC